jgi:hypothetical protein
MAEDLEWDWPPTKRCRKRRRPRIEVLPPERGQQQRRPQRIEVVVRTHQHSNDTRTFLVIFVAALFILRYKFALLLIGVLAWKVLLAILLIPVIIALAAWRERRSTRGVWPPTKS